MPYTRAWELLLGTILSLRMFPRLTQSSIRNLVALAGLAMIAYADLTYLPTTLFPGPAALLPCVGTAFIVWAGESGSSAVYSILSWRPVVFIGLISYSLYLWHWPVVMVDRMGIFDNKAAFERAFGAMIPPDRFDHFLQIAISLILAVLSWKFVEQPFRKGRLRLTGKPLFVLSGAVVLICVVFSSVVIASGGLEDRFSPPVLKVASFLDPPELRQNEKAQRLGTCFLDATTGVQTFNFNYCLQQDPHRSNYLLLGDSHAAALWPALAALLPKVNVMQANVTSCFPTLHHRESDLCSKVMNYVYQTYLPEHPVNELLLEADWDPASVEDLGRTLRWAKAHHVPVTVVGCVPEYDAPLARLLAYSMVWHNPAFPGEHRLARDGKMEAELRSLVTGTLHLPFASPYDAICRGGQCTEYANAAEYVPLMDDSHHLNRFGAIWVVRRLVDAGEIH